MHNHKSSPYMGVSGRPTVAKGSMSGMSEFRPSDLPTISTRMAEAAIDIPVAYGWIF